MNRFLTLTMCLLGPATHAVAATTDRSVVKSPSTPTHHHKHIALTHTMSVGARAKPDTTPMTSNHAATQNKATRDNVTRRSTTRHTGSVAVAAHSAAHHGGKPHTARVAIEPTPLKPTALPPPAAPVTQVAPEPNKGSATGLPLPRFAALRSDQVNWRAGPGTRYPIDWIYQRRDLPVEIEREFEVWRLVSEADGTKGWVHQATLTGRRSFVIMGDQPQTLRAAATPAAAAVATLKPGVVGQLQSCPAGSEWCAVSVKAYHGYLNRSAFWGSLPNETVGP